MDFAALLTTEGLRCDPYRHGDGVGDRQRRFISVLCDRFRKPDVPRPKAWTDRCHGHLIFCSPLVG